MKVSELIEQLQNLDPDMEVMYEHPSHDHWRTVLASEVSRVEENTVRYAEYHRQHVLAGGYDEDEEDSDPRKQVALIG
jgi:hypothetical protein